MRKTKLVLLIFICVFFAAFPVQAKINFQTVEQDKIDLETLKTDRDQFFEFVKSTILNRPSGLGNYGTVSFHACDMEIGNQKLIDYKTMEGKRIKFLSNPSCNQTVIRRVLENSYKYSKTELTSYQNRQCILSVEKIISPMLEYYTIKYEEQKKPDCSACDYKEKERLDLILSTQRKIIQHCKVQADNVMKFISELDTQIETAYKNKVLK
ncbi:hypothetical protein KJ966_26995 [bacterium]|nr:hypothetical protein [bacterium]